MQKEEIKPSSLLKFLLEVCSEMSSVCSDGQSSPLSLIRSVFLCVFCSEPWAKGGVISAPNP